MPAFFEAGKPDALKDALADLCAAAEAAVRDDAVGCLVLSDRDDDAPLDAGRVPIPTLLAVGAVHHHLIARGVRSDTSIVAETAQAFSTHHIAVLVGYGAHAVCPYLAFETCRQWRGSNRVVKLIKGGRIPSISMEGVQQNFKKALEKGVLKILSKMGISLLSCYHGAQIFEAYGLGEEVVDTAFRGSVSRIGGLSFADLQVRCPAPQPGMRPDLLHQSQLTFATQLWACFVRPGPAARCCYAPPGGRSLCMHGS